jgi:TIR domain/Pentapeptide repeats (8 copies)
MGDSEHVEQLKQSVEEWNQWRLDHPDISPSLNFADLRGANLRDATLSGISLARADLNHADLSGAHLSGADLSHAILSEAILSEVTLSRANLSDANLSDANLSGANLSGANLSGADLSEVYFYDTTFARIDLSNVKGLDTAFHNGPSVVDTKSVTFPFDEHTRRHFMSGVGFSNTFIDYLPSLLVTPIQYHSLFISYSHRDQTFAERLHRELQKKGVRCWFAPHDLRPGTPILRGIEEAIHLHEKLLLILTKHAVNSSWVEREVDAALYQEIERSQDVLFPIRLDNTVLESTAGWARRLRHRHIGDFTQWQEEDAYQQAFTTLLRHLKISIPNKLKHSP